MILMYILFVTFFSFV